MNGAEDNITGEMKQKISKHVYFFNPVIKELTVRVSEFRVNWLSSETVVIPLKTI